ncbi:nicotinate-nucleotide adenylyltransferase [Oceaniglobus roseus]|uniref:nicotinate-nucleotide adenylyltransferase n=1 Tax=Oceaniglobus roseus TaxID=1737570 RepID=UPI000C7EC97A|nr:nicotinate-nucleotide adenylyltransferase [Kandeliimicrobium roseum]
MTRRRPGWPVARAGQRIGLLGGSFDPAHEGHAHITREALKRFDLDAVWWLVSPGNPLKARGPAPMERRLEQARQVMRHPRVEITALERDLGTRYTAATLEALLPAYPGVHFVWLMGADSLATFHLWDRWQWIMSHVPVGVLARPGLGIVARMSPAAARFEPFRLPARRAKLLALSAPPAWCFVNLPMNTMSSSAIRARGGWQS